MHSYHYYWLDGDIYWQFLALPLIVREEKSARLLFIILSAEVEEREIEQNQRTKQARARAALIEIKNPKPNEKITYLS